MKKLYVLDTNIFIYEPDCLFLFQEHDLYVSPVTLREITHLKHMDGEVGYSARRVKAKMDDLRRANPGSTLLTGIPLGKGLGKLYIIPDVDFSDFAPGMSSDSNDDMILASASYLSSQISFMLRHNISETGRYRMRSYLTQVGQRYLLIQSP